MTDAGVVEELADGLRRRLAGRSGRTFVGVDGWSGSGKTTLGLELATALRGPCVHLDDLVPGWHGLASSVDRLVAEVLPALAAGRPARWQTWDWAADAWDGWSEQAPAPLVVVEGCGAGAVAVRPWLTALVWLEVDEEERTRRLREREDWALYEAWVAVWGAQERDLRAGDDPRPHADAVVEDGRTRTRLRWASTERH
jgi:cytidylate kinase